MEIIQEMLELLKGEISAHDLDQSIKDIQISFNASINHRSKDTESVLSRFELAGYFLFDFNITDGSFGGIIIGRDLQMM